MLAQVAGVKMASLKYFEGAMPGKRRKKTDEEKRMRQKEYEDNRKKRTFNEKWQEQRSWLEFDADQGKMFCTECKEYYGRKGDADDKNQFLNGSTNFRLSSVDDHGKSKVHLKAHDFVLNRLKTLEEKMQSKAGKALSQLQTAERSRGGRGVFGLPGRVGKC